MPEPQSLCEFRVQIKGQGRWITWTRFSAEAEARASLEDMRKKLDHSTFRLVRHTESDEDLNA